MTIIGKHLRKGPRPAHTDQRAWELCPSVRHSIPLGTVLSSTDSVTAPRSLGNEDTSIHLLLFCAFSDLADTKEGSQLRGRLRDSNPTKQTAFAPIQLSERSSLDIDAAISHHFFPTPPKPTKM
jgi:hypothetical protein